MLLYYSSFEFVKYVVLYPLASRTISRIVNGIKPVRENMKFRVFKLNWIA